MFAELAGTELVTALRAGPQDLFAAGILRILAERT
jgi:hypothetical protein